ncbi:hypothetical protein [Geitlerinema sp. PCC 9228]|uniref:hypothetical protein n=1 Tax=Geitlerinema sp. PCC 9228 TaxID=111611 RepID=UPI00147DC240|nr:hypothetical protein [Geitlerinema sp. PCC 9228]
MESEGKCDRYEYPNRFKRLCYWALSEQYISLPKAAELLQKPVKEIQKAIQGPTPVA